MTIELPKLGIRTEKLKMKVCQFPGGCSSPHYMGTAFSKYCSEHRKKNYRKIIAKLSKKVVEKDDLNQIYRHNITKPQFVTFTCPACCGDFDVMVYPDTFIYPKYCPDHRTVWRRNYYMQTHGIFIDSVIVANKDITEAIIECVEFDDIDEAIISEELA